MKITSHQSNPCGKHLSHLGIFPVAVLLVVLACAGSGCQSTRPRASASQTKDSQASLAPSAALEKLKSGNLRFAAGRPQVRDMVADRVATASGQYPFAVVLSCVDSRCSSEQIFDQGIGDIFSARVAGNVLNDDILGSMEFACKVAGAKLIAVVGHSKCGAIKGACGRVQLGNLTGLLDKIQPAVAATLGAAERHDLGAGQIDAVAEANVNLVLKQIRERSPVLSELMRQGQVRLVGGFYDLDTGLVRFLE